MYLSFNAGWIEVITGPMFSGKSEELIKRLTTLKFANQKFICFKPKVDTRWKSDCVSSRAGSSIKSVSLANAKDALNYIDEKTYVVAFDEAQFFKDDLTEMAHILSDRGIRVIISGLDLNVYRKPFGCVGDIMVFAEFITKLKAICFVCGKAASFSYRKENSPKTIIQIGDKQYEARCRKHYL